MAVDDAIDPRDDRLVLQGQREAMGAHPCGHGHVHGDRRRTGQRRGTRLHDEVVDRGLHEGELTDGLKVVPAMVEREQVRITGGLSRWCG